MLKFSVNEFSIITGFVNIASKSVWFCEYSVIFFFHSMLMVSGTIESKLCV